MNETVTISDVRIKTLANGRELFIIQDSSGQEYSTMKRELAERARTWKGGLAMLTFDVKEKNGFVNRYLNAVDEAPMSNGNAGFTVDTPQRDPDERRIDIARSVALKAAIDLACHGQLDMTAPADLTKVANFLVGWLLEGHEALVEEDIPF